MRVTAASAARPFLLLAVFASTWTGVLIGGLQIVDIALLVATALVGLDAVTGGRGFRIPWWIAIGTASVVLVAVLHVALPTGIEYYATRAVVASSAVDAMDGTPGSLLIATRWIIAMAVLPIVAAYLAQTRPAVVRQMAIAFVAGVSVSAIVALSDWAGLSNVSTTLLGSASWTGRESGLASHQNNLGFACSLAVPLAVYVFRYARVLSVLALVFATAGAVVSGSRGAQVGVAVAFLASTLLLQTGRKAVVWGAVLAALSLVLVNVLFPGYLTSSVGLFRFDGASSAASDTERTIIQRQGWQDFAMSPFDGVGFPVITNAHSVPIQLLAAGGLILLIGFALYIVGAIGSGIKRRDVMERISVPATICVVLWMAQGVVQNQLVDRYLYVPIAIIACVEVLARVKAPKHSRAPARSHQ